MGKRIIGIAVALALIAPVSSTAAGSKSPKLAKCDGKQRRPANPYGSILPTVDPVSGGSAPAGQTPARLGVEVFLPKNRAGPTPAGSDGQPDSQVPPISRWSPPTFNQSC